MNCREIIKKNIKLFSKKNYFLCFSKLLTEASLNLFNKNYRLLTNSLEDIESFYLKRNKKTKRESLWNIIMINILFIKEKNEEYYNIDFLSYKYLLRLSTIKIKQLLSISIKFKLDLSFCVKIYLELCEEKINSIKNTFSKILSIKNRKSSNHIKRFSTYGRMPLFRNTSQKEDTKKGVKNEKDIKPIKSINKIVSKKSNNLNNFLYCNSFTRLFIGDTDEESVKQRHLSNIVVKNEQRLNLHGSYIALSGRYLKQLYHKIVKQNQMQDSNGKQLINNNKKLIEIEKIFKKDYRKIENLKKINEKDNEKQINNKTQTKFFYPSIIDYNKNNKYKNSHSSLDIKKNKKYLPFKLSKNIKKKNGVEIKLSPNVNNTLNILREPIKKDNNSMSSIGYNSNNLTARECLNNTLLKTNINVNRNFCNKKIKVNKFLFKKKLFFNSTNGNSLNGNLKKKKTLKNFLSKEDFFFEGLS